MEIFLEAAVNTRDTGFSRARTVFTACLFIKYVGFLLEEHLARLFDHCRKADIRTELLPSSIEIAEMVKRAICYNLHEDKASMVKIYVTAGKARDGRMPDEDPQIIIDVLDFIAPSTTPIKLELIDWMPLIPEIKLTANYGGIVSKDRALHERGFDDFLYTTREGKITESTTANIFFVNDNELWAPSENIMAGTTRTKVLELAHEAKIFPTVDETSSVLAKLLPRFNEAFITSTSRGITPVVRINDYEFVVGANTKTTQLQKLFIECRAQYFRERGIDITKHGV